MARQESWTWWIEKKEKVMNFAVLVPSDAEKNSRHVLYAISI